MRYYNAHYRMDVVGDAESADSRVARTSRLRVDRSGLFRRFRHLLHGVAAARGSAEQVEELLDV